MYISDFSTDTNTIDQQVADVKAYALANYNNKRGWDIVIETMTDAELAAAIGKRKNTRAAINAVYAHVQPFHERRSEMMADVKIEPDAIKAPAPAPQPEQVVEPAADKGAARKAKRADQQRARRQVARDARA